MEIITEIKNNVLSILRIVRRIIIVSGKSHFLTYGKYLHIGANVRLWAPNQLVIGDNVYIGKDCHIECDATIGDYCLIANQVSFVGRNDHDYSVVGMPIRFAPWVGDKKKNKQINDDIQLKVVIEQDVWIGFGVIVLSGVTIGRGSVVSAGSVVTSDIEPYSIVAGMPAKKIKSRFNEEQIIKHEMALSKGVFRYSEKGLRYSLIQPWKDESMKF